jgi:hypothetical protein
VPTRIQQTLRYFRSEVYIAIKALHKIKRINDEKKDENKNKKNLL